MVSRQTSVFVGLFTAVEKLWINSLSAIFIYSFTVMSCNSFLNVLYLHTFQCCFFLFGLFSQLLEAQADYHRKSLTVLENVLPTIQAQQGNITCKQEPPVKSISRKDGWVVPVYFVSLQANFSCETQGNVPLGMLQIVA